MKDHKIKIFVIIAALLGTALAFSLKAQTTGLTKQLDTIYIESHNDTVRFQLTQHIMYPNIIAATDTSYRIQCEDDINGVQMFIFLDNKRQVDRFINDIAENEKYDYYVKRHRYSVKNEWGCIGIWNSNGHSRHLIDWQTYTDLVKAWNIHNSKN